MPCGDLAVLARVLTGGPARVKKRGELPGQGTAHAAALGAMAGLRYASKTGANSGDRSGGGWNGVDKADPEGLEDHQEESGFR